MKLAYLEQQLLAEELTQVLLTSPQQHRSREGPVGSAPVGSRDSACYVTGAADLRHCLRGVASDVTLLGVQEEHLKAVVEGVREERVRWGVRWRVWGGVRGG